jgi:3-hydroxyisobutyrate dehydrogenase-like beta-hydroxyacid dehydrogenase
MTIVGVVSPGAMGSALARVLVRGRARAVATLEGRSARTAALATAAGVELLTDLDAVVAESDVVLSVAPPGQAESIGRVLSAAALRTGARPLVADLNAISPDTARRIEATLREAEVDLVDGSISGPPPRPGTSTRIYLSGWRAGEVAGLPLPGVDVRVVGSEIGTASAVKMSTASVYKGSVALLTQALRTAHANGVAEHVLDDLAASSPELVEGAETTIARAVSKSGRYVGEMREIAATQAARGLPPSLFEAMAEVYAELARTALGREAPEDVDPERPLGELLAELDAGEPGGTRPGPPDIVRGGSA